MEKMNKKPLLATLGLVALLSGCGESSAPQPAQPATKKISGPIELIMPEYDQDGIFTYTVVLKNGDCASYWNYTDRTLVNQFYSRSENSKRQNWNVSIEGVELPSGCIQTGNIQWNSGPQ